MLLLLRLQAYYGIDINMMLEDYIGALPTKRRLSVVKMKILQRLWGQDSDCFPKPWVSSAELLELTNQKYFDRRTRELRDQLGCDVESSYQEQLGGHAWRINSPDLSEPQDREYLSQSQKIKLFKDNDYCCAICGTQIAAGVRGLQADHKIPISRSGGNEIGNWQPLCNNCNVGKRRACDSCDLDCNTCSWAFPEIVGIKTMVSVSEQALRRIDGYSKNSSVTRDEIMEAAVLYYLDHKEKNS